MANFNRQAVNKKMKLKRRRREVARTIAKWQADSNTAQAAGGQPADLTRKIKDLQRSMRSKK